MCMSRVSPILSRPSYISCLQIRGPFLKGLETFSHPESCSKISKLMITELFDSHTCIFNMKWGSLHTRSFRRIHLSVFRYRLSKSGFVCPKRASFPIHGHFHSHSQFMDTNNSRLTKLNVRCFIVFHWTCILSGPSVPQNLSAQSVSSTEILVSWKTPENTNGKIKYRLSFYKTSELSAAPKLVYDGNATQHLVSNLKPFTRYTLKVLAYNVKYNLSSASIDTSEKTDESRKFAYCFEFLYGETPSIRSPKGHTNLSV